MGTGIRKPRTIAFTLLGLVQNTSGDDGIMQSVYRAGLLEDESYESDHLISLGLMYFPSPTDREIRDRITLWGRGNAGHNHEGPSFKPPSQHPFPFQLFSHSHSQNHELPCYSNSYPSRSRSSSLGGVLPFHPRYCSLLSLPTVPQPGQSLGLGSRPVRHEFLLLHSMCLQGRICMMESDLGFGGCALEPFRPNN